MKVDYSKGKIYKITNDYNDDVYVGSTCDTLVKRFSLHKIESTNERSKHRKIYNAFNEIGFERFRIELLEDYPCEDIYQLRQREGYYIRQYGTLNKLIAGRTKEQYREDNKEKIKEKDKQYYKDNKEKIKNYYQDNKEKIKINTAIKINCVCGSSFCKGNLSKHEKSKKHINYINNNSSDSQIE